MEVEEIRINNEEDFKNLQKSINSSIYTAKNKIENKEKSSWETYYRGEAAEFETVANIFRHNEETLECQIIENWLKKNTDNDKSLTTIGKMQHYGEHTRLLDFSTDINVALFFACKENLDKQGFVYCYHTDCISDEKDENCQILTDFCFFNILGDIPLHEFIKNEGQEYKKTVDSIVTLLKRDHFLNYDLLKEENERIKRQKGLFLWMGDTSLTKKSEFKGKTEKLSFTNGRGKDYPGIVLTVIIKPEMKKVIMKFLNEKGYNEEYLMPKN